MDEHERQLMLKKIVYTRYNANTISCEHDFLAQLDLVRRSGYALDLGEERAGVRCIGAPIFNRYAKAVAAVWITGPEGRIPDAVIPSHGGAIIDCANEISQKLGYMKI